MGGGVALQGQAWLTGRCIILRLVERLFGLDHYKIVIGALSNL